MSQSGYSRPTFFMNDLIVFVFSSRPTFFMNDLIVFVFFFIKAKISQICKMLINYFLKKDSCESFGFIIRFNLLPGLPPHRYFSRVFMYSAKHRHGTTSFLETGSLCRAVGFELIKPEWEDPFNSLNMMLKLNL